MTPYRILLMGTPEFAVPCLRLLSADQRFSVAAVVTQPDKPAGRGQKRQPPPIKLAALDLGISVLQPLSLKGLRFRDGSLSANADEMSSAFALEINGRLPLDAVLVVAYGKIIPDALLELCSCGAVNIHPSLLPRWRGAAPIQRALFSGDTETGVSLMRLDRGLDTGPVYTAIRTSIEPAEDFGHLSARLANLGARLATDKLPEIISGALTAAPQAEDGVTYAEKWDKTDLAINWEEPAELILRRIRASSPDSGARTLYNNEPIKIYRAALSTECDALPGTITAVTVNEVLVACGDRRTISLAEIQFPGKNRINIAQALRGRAFCAGEIFKPISAAG